METKAKHVIEIFLEFDTGSMYSRALIAVLFLMSTSLERIANEYWKRERNQKQASYKTGSETN